MSTALLRPEAAPPEMRLGPRLKALVDLCPSTGAVADIGSGHGRLALALKRRDPRRLVFATESKPGPAGELRRILGPLSGVGILEGVGLQPLAGRGVVGAVIAGMGGNTIVRILDSDRALAERLVWLCLQPAQRAEPLEGWLGRSRWMRTATREVSEKGHLYRTFLVRPQ
ncbi:MAG: tRNA (adenine(22)-N(1))-methyltransferase TrmK [Candidatus Dormibacteria bacterium]